MAQITRYKVIFAPVLPSERTRAFEDYWTYLLMRDGALQGGGAIARAQNRLLSEPAGTSSTCPATDHTSTDHGRTRTLAGGPIPASGGPPVACPDRNL